MELTIILLSSRSLGSLGTIGLGSDSRALATVDFITELGSFLLDTAEAVLDAVIACAAAVESCDATHVKLDIR